MEEATAVSAISVLPDEVMIEILSRVDSSNHLELRFVCKLWKSLVLAPHFMQNHLLIAITDLAALNPKVTENFNAFKSRIMNNLPLPVAPNAEEEEHVDAEEDEEHADADDAGADADGPEEEEEDVDADADDAEEEDADAEEDGVGVDAVPGADVDGADAEEEEKEDADGDVAEEDGVGVDGAEEDGVGVGVGVDVFPGADGDVADAEEDGVDVDGADVEEEEDEEEHFKTNGLTQLVNLMEKEKQLMKKEKNLNNHDEKLMIIRVAKCDKFLRVIRYMKSSMQNFLNSMVEDRVVSKGNLETISLEIKTMHDRFKCFKNFQQIYHKGLQHCLRAAKDSL